MSVQKFFPSQIYVGNDLFPNTDQKNEELLAEIFKISEIDEAGLEWCDKHYFGGYTSYASYNRLQDFSTNFKELEDALRPHIDKYLSALEYDIEIDQLKMSDCWANIMPMGTHHSGHIHPQSVISGTYYLQVPEDGPAIKFEDPRLPLLMNAPIKKDDADIENKSFVSLTTKEGECVLFESFLRHEVPTNLSEEDRVSISFNYQWA